MIIQPGKLQGIYDITMSPNQDHRGYFARLYDQEIMSAHGLHRNWVQENRSYSIRKGTIRGLHFQFAPHAETKLIWVSRGVILDVFVDVRLGSPTFGCYDSRLLSENSGQLVYISPGFAHGFCTLVDNCEVVYKVDNVYSPAHEGGIAWNDPSLNIPWPVELPIMSEKDRKLPTLEQLKKERLR
ncbi:dTDP-4-dehydrorhamnose 3,5-epimerase [Bacillus sp. 3255]|uniref:dTDP-4-dehydrorhamnose 3,5-epimerase n=1 Tax=Bacillus sp. 3255 TaxID=2817904 RepID=UPI0028660F7D|nr:dTDP-4-dehydrorhamnose 3,5-epimerase [Bacillus sp. 3255]MDR6884831.1 dTDP-4-dehydrorhamnose 3,5-epimerase [Bacillus sp. 3255]